MNPGKYQVAQMEIAWLSEWESGSQEAKGRDVYHAGSGRVREEWLSRCREERALTADLMSDVASLSNLSAAARRVISNGGSAGIDGMPTTKLKEWLLANHKSLTSSLLKGEYLPQLVRGVEIPKPNGGKRQLGIPTVVDRLVQQAIHQVLEKRYDRTFSDHSYGFRQGRGCHPCIKQAGEYVSQGYRHIVDIDLAKFFDEVNHNRMLWLLSRRIGDKRLVKLIGRFLRSGMMQDGLTSQRIKGTPQGSPFTPPTQKVTLLIFPSQPPFCLYAMVNNNGIISH